MAKNRYVNTEFWVDSYIARLGTSEKLAFLYLLTTPLANISGVYQMPMRNAVFDTGLEKEDFTAALNRFEADGKIVRHGDWIGIVNFAKHQKPNPNVRIGIAKELGKAPRELIERLPSTAAVASKAFGRLAHLNPNLNSNKNPNLKADLFTAPSTGLSTGNPQEDQSSGQGHTSEEDDEDG